MAGAGRNLVSRGCVKSDRMILFGFQLSYYRHRDPCDRQFQQLRPYGKRHFRFATGIGRFDFSFSVGVNGTLRALACQPLTSLPVDRRRQSFCIAIFSIPTTLFWASYVQPVTFAFVLLANTFSSPQPVPLTGPLIICFSNFISSPRPFAGYEVAPI